MPKTKSITILGIDPGYALTGYAVLNLNAADQNINALTYGVIKTSARQDFTDRLVTLHRELNVLIAKYRPQLMAVEDLFFYNNAKTAINVGQARGVIILTASLHHLPIVHYTPLQIKQSVAAYGKAEKQQVQKMMKLLLRLKNLPRPDDAADALAVAYCGLQTQTIYHL